LGKFIADKAQQCFSIKLCNKKIIRHIMFSVTIKEGRPDLELLDNGSSNEVNIFMGKCRRNENVTSIRNKF
jgi:hypothetical protein